MSKWLFCRYQHAHGDFISPFVVICCLWYGVIVFSLMVAFRRRYWRHLPTLARLLQLIKHFLAFSRSPVSSRFWPFFKIAFVVQCLWCRYCPENWDFTLRKFRSIYGVVTLGYFYYFLIVLVLENLSGFEIHCLVVFPGVNKNPHTSILLTFRDYQSEYLLF